MAKAQRWSWRSWFFRTFSVKAVFECTGCQWKAREILGKLGMPQKTSKRIKVVDLWKALVWDLSICVYIYICIPFLHVPSGSLDVCEWINSLRITAAKFLPQAVTRHWKWRKRSERAVDEPPAGLGQKMTEVTSSGDLKLYTFSCCGAWKCLEVPVEPRELYILFRMILDVSPVESFWRIVTGGGWPVSPSFAMTASLRLVLVITLRMSAASVLTNT